MADRMSKSFSHPPKRSKSSMSSSASRSPSRFANESSYKEKNGDFAYRTADATRRNASRRKRNLSVREMVNSNNLNNSDFGIQGYHIPKFNAYFDKPIGTKWIKNKIPTMWDTIDKSAKKAPSPDHYQK